MKWFFLSKNLPSSQGETDPGFRLIYLTLLWGVIIAGAYIIAIVLAKVYS